MSRPDEERVWLQFAIAATGHMCSIDALTDDTVLTSDAANIADRMVIKWRERYDAEALANERAMLAKQIETNATGEDAQW